MKLALPPKSAFFVHEFRHRETKLLHSVVTIQQSYRRTARSRAICGTPIPRDKAWRRPPGSPPVQRCGQCADNVAALDDLLEEK